MQRVLSVSLSHAIRGAALVLLPFAFIALVAWATAGSATGTTTDPIRGAAWIWLGAHHIPFSLALPPTGIPGYFSYLPWGAIALPFIAIRTTFNRALDRLQGDFHDINGVRTTYSLFYTIIVTALAYMTASPTVTPQWYLAPIFAFFISITATLTCGQRLAISAPVILASRIMAIIVGTFMVVVGALIFTNFAQVKVLTVALQPGIFGGALLLLLNILYLPNAAVALASYVAGTGFAAGAGTLISPWWYHSDQLPVFPLLGILPTQRHPLFIASALFFVAIGALLAYWSLNSGVQMLIQTSIFLIALIFLIAFLSSGSLMTDDMGAFGVSIWEFGLVAIGEIGIGAVITTFIAARKAQ
ncbi:hypothetical protein MCEMRE182_01165 [Candidatus Nanopelagicaceae bacterium]